MNRRVKIMNSLVLELQAAAWNSEEKVTNLLRKALVVARKLGVTEFEEWITAEMYEYKESQLSLPNYRKVRGHVRAETPYHGWQDVHFDSNEIENLYSIREMGHPISELEDLYNKADKTIAMRFPATVSQHLYKAIGHDVVLVISSTLLFKILDIVKMTIIDWALKLEQDGILGEGMTFSSEEKEKASQQNYTTIIYGMHNSQIQQGANSTQHLNTGINVSEVKELLMVVSTLMNSVDLDTSGQNEVQNELQTIQNELEEELPKPGIIKSSLFAIGRIVGGAGESIISDQLATLVTEYAKNIM